jgi:hypothetical protein
MYEAGVAAGPALAPASDEIQQQRELPVRPMLLLRLAQGSTQGATAPLHEGEASSAARAKQ